MQVKKQYCKKIFKATITFLWWLPLVAFGNSQTVVTEPVKLLNPLKVDSIQGLLVAVINVVMVLMVPVIVFYIIYSGFKYVMARGNASQVEEASQSLLYSILGGVLILGAFAIASIIQNIVTSFQNTPTP